MFLGRIRRVGLWLAGVRVRRLLLFAGLAFAALPAGSALAGTTIGQTGGGAPCFPGGGGVAADTNYVVPTGGTVITSFSFQSDSSNTGQQLDFLVLAPETGSDYSVVGKTGVVTLAGTGLETFPADISVQSGDILGFWTNASELNNCAHDVSSGGGALGGFVGGDPNIGDTVTLNQPDSLLDINVSANLETTPPNKEACKKGGWQGFTDNNGTPFKNQGDCVSFIATGGKNPASG